MPGGPAPNAVVAAGAPRTWLLLGEKPGDNAQARVLADALGWPYQVRHLRMRPEWLLGKPRVRPSLAHLDLSRSDALEPPWPELVITVGRRLSSAALWIRRQSAGRARLVLIGKPRRHLRRFDLVVATAQYRLRERPNVVRIGLPLVRVDTAAAQAAAGAWRARLAPLRRPLLALLVGGPTKAVRFDTAVARDLAARAARAAEEAGGSLYVCTSRRTTEPIAQALAAALPAGTPLYRFRPGDPENPYLGLLGAADRFAVTSDSVTMLAEVAQLGRELAVIRLPPRRRLLRTLLRSRDLEAPVRVLLARGLAVELGQPWRKPEAAASDDLERAAARVRGLFAAPPREANDPAK
jgi:mitochondrial fission protein ELM1